MRAFGIFQGGGAKGYAHVGALQAAEDRDVRFVGLAGTSIGAVIAALAAAGYGGRELFDVRDGEPSGLLALDPKSVLSTRELASAERLERTARWLGSDRFRSLRRVSRSLPVRWAAQPALYAWHLMLFRRLRRHKGMMGLEGFQAWLDDVLRRKLGLPDDGRPVRFGDLPTPLRCVAADLTAGGVRVFGGRADAHVGVAAAVAASACYPLIFRPVSIDGREYVDGGLISTLPAWVFDEEREDHHEPVPTFGFRLLDQAGPSFDDTAQPLPRSFLAFLRRLLRTTLSATRTLEDRAVEDYYAVDLTADVPSMSLSELKVARPGLVARGKADAESFFRREVGPRDPEAMRVVLRVIANALRSDLGVSGRVRTYILLPLEDGRRARVFYSANMEDDADSRLTMRRNLPGPSRCLDLREPVLLRPAKALANPARNPAQRLEAAIRRATVDCLYAVPVFADPADWALDAAADRASPIAGFCLDCDQDVSGLLIDPDIEDRVASYAQLVGEHLRLLPLRPGATARNPADVRMPGWRYLDGTGLLQVSSRVHRALVLDDTMADMVKRAETLLKPHRGRHPLRDLATDDARQTAAPTSSAPTLASYRLDTT